MHEVWNVAPIHFFLQFCKFSMSFFHHFCFHSWINCHPYLLLPFSTTHFFWLVTSRWAPSPSQLHSALELCYYFWVHYSTSRIGPKDAYSSKGTNHHPQIFFSPNVVSIEDNLRIPIECTILTLFMEEKEKPDGACVFLNFFWIGQRNYQKSFSQDSPEHIA